MKLAAVLLALAQLLSPVVATYGCLDEAGRPVDWFMALKAPGGGEYYYLDANKPKELVYSKNNMEDETGAIITTIKQLYDTDAGTDAWMTYNDQDDHGKAASSSRAHAKGVIVFDKSQGFWLVHSLPKYPARASEGYNGLSDTRYGQSWICMTLAASQFETVGKQIATNWVGDYDSNAPAFTARVAPSFKKFVDSGSRGADLKSLKQVKTLKGVSFDVFARSGKANNELYDDWVNIFYSSDLIAETWQNGRGKMYSNCNMKYSVYNAASIHFPNKDWRITQDHSKWCLTVNSSKKVVCIGDINRQTSQAGRGGGTVCIKNTDVWDAFDKALDNIESCKGSNSDAFKIRAALSNSSLPVPEISYEAFKAQHQMSAETESETAPAQKVEKVVKEGKIAATTM